MREVKGIFYLDSTGFFLLVLLMFCVFPLDIHAETIFEDNFDSHSDWLPAIEECGEGCATAPTNWTFYRSTGDWEAATGGEDTIRIAADNARGGIGKAFTVWNESRDGSSGWGADGMISTLLPEDHTEIYAQVWIKYDPTWQAPSPSGDMAIKTFRIEHYDRSGNPFSYFSTGNSCPVYMYQFKHSNTYGTRFHNSFRCDSQSTEYYCPNNDYMVEETDFSASLQNDTYEPQTGSVGSYNSAGMPADGEWHKYNWHVKMNTYSGSGVWNSDGVLQAWIDGELVTDVSHIRWVESGTDSTIGWNIIILGGNAYNTYDDETNKSEQWYAMDDLIISTTPIIGYTSELLPPSNVEVVISH